MSDDKKTESDENEQPYPGHGPHADGPGAEEDYSDHRDLEVDPNFTVTPGTETSEERREIAKQRREEIIETRSGKTEEDPDDDDVELSDESDDDKPVLPSTDSPVHGEDTVTEGSTDPTL